jgi:50S ribosomal subunit-associated GTPase HflX
MLKKQIIVTVNKIDLYTSQQIDTFRSSFIDKDTNVIFFSTFTNEGMLEIKKAIGKTL